MDIKLSYQKIRHHARRIICDNNKAENKCHCTAQTAMQIPLFHTFSPPKVAACRVRYVQCMYVPTYVSYMYLTYMCNTLTLTGTDATWQLPEKVQPHRAQALRPASYSRHIRPNAALQWNCRPSKLKRNGEKKKKENIHPSKQSTTDVPCKPLPEEVATPTHSRRRCNVR